MRKILLTFLLLAGNLCLYAQKIDWTSFFANDIDTLSSSDENALKIWAASHYHFRHEVLEIRGHADQNAESDYNEKLSMRRAKHIEAVLREQGFDNVRLTYYGESVPLCEGKDESCLSRNRRVEVLLYNEWDEKWMANAKLEAPEVIFFSSEKKVTIEGEKGTKVYVGLGELLAPNGHPYFGPVRAEMREILTPVDCINANISTLCDKQLIETGGMCELLLYRAIDNAPLSVNNFIEIQFPSQQSQLQEGMQTFAGVVQGNNMIWDEGNWEVEPFDLKWYSIEKKTTSKGSEFYPSGFGVPGVEGNVQAKYVYKCDTIWLSKEQLKKKKANMYVGRTLSNSVKSGNLGWINCDRFLNQKNTEVLALNCEVPINRAVVVFDNRRIALDYFQFPYTKIPVNEPVTIVSYGTMNEEGKIPFAITKTVFVGSKLDVEMEWLTAEELEKRTNTLAQMWQ